MAAASRPVSAIEVTPSNMMIIGVIDLPQSSIDLEIGRRGRPCLTRRANLLRLRAIDRSQFRVSPYRTRLAPVISPFPGIACLKGF
jgi:hypothetical protein